MKKRNIIFVSVMSLVTLGIYFLYWVYTTSKEMAAKGIKVPSFLLIVLPVVAFTGSMISLIVLALSAESNSDADTGLKFSVIFFVLAGTSILLFLISGIYWLVKYCEAVEKVTKGKLEAEVNILLFIVLVILSVTFVWPGMVQYYFNKIAGSKSRSS